MFLFTEASFASRVSMVSVPSTNGYTVFETLMDISSAVGRIATGLSTSNLRASPFTVLNTAYPPIVSVSSFNVRRVSTDEFAPYKNCMAVKGSCETRVQRFSTRNCPFGAENGALNVTTSPASSIKSTAVPLAVAANAVPFDSVTSRLPETVSVDALVIAPPVRSSAVPSAIWTFPSTVKAPSSCIFREESPVMAKSPFTVIVPPFIANATPALSSCPSLCVNVEQQTEPPFSTSAFARAA